MCVCVCAAAARVARASSKTAGLASTLKRKKICHDSCLRAFLSLALSPGMP